MKELRGFALALVVSGLLTGCCGTTARPVLSASVCHDRLQVTLERGVILFPTLLDGYPFPGKVEAWTVGFRSDARSLEAMLKELRWREIRKVLPQAKEGQTERTFHVERGGRAQDNRVSYDEMLSRTYVIYFAWDDMSEVAQARDRLQGSPFVESVEYCPVAEWE
jgi:hypothetical protein